MIEFSLNWRRRECVACESGVAKEKDTDVRQDTHTHEYTPGYMYQMYIRVYSQIHIHLYIYILRIDKPVHRYLHMYTDTHVD